MTRRYWLLIWLRLLAWLGHSRSRRRLGQFNRKRHSSFVAENAPCVSGGDSHRASEAS